ncbi:hypothetical protein H206_05515 [Candidatus Electrothrix aarhusensis]|uniref:Uncharacterized protein n=1 Tax=Candidatus Electrothrix aarhusensis TaxID=1859131 RepID=A0A444J473_9BACT|nr:hypothetical protein H206_05515 [Candidatus Electrothrix aarhusensis]
MNISISEKCGNILQLYCYPGKVHLFFLQNDLYGNRENHF